VTLVDIAGYFFVFATRSVITHVLFFFGVTNRVPLIEQGPDSDHVLFPVDTLRTKLERSGCDFLAATVLITLNPGRATIVGVAELVPEDVCAATVKEYSLPLRRPCTTHPVAVVVHTVTPSEFVTTYVTGSELLTLLQVKVSALLDTAMKVSVGVVGGGITTGGGATTGGGSTNGVTVVLAAPLPLTFEATVEMT
jgi:hypothetical protein